MFNGSDFTKLVGEFPQEVKLDQRIHFQAKVKTNDSDIAVLIEKCIATPTMDVNHPSSHTLIKDRYEFLDVASNPKVKIVQESICCTALLNLDVFPKVSLQLFPKLVS